MSRRDGISSNPHPAAHLGLHVDGTFPDTMYEFFVLVDENFSEFDGFACTCNVTRIVSCYLSNLFIRRQMKNRPNFVLCSLIGSHPLHDITFALLLKRARSVVAHSSLPHTPCANVFKERSCFSSFIPPSIRPPSSSVRPSALFANL